MKGATMKATTERRIGASPGEVRIEGDSSSHARFPLPVWK